MPPINARHQDVTAQRMIRALFLLKYGPRAASTRHRHLQFIPYLGAHGFECDVSWLLSDKYLSDLLDRSRLQVPYVYDFDDAIFHQYDLNSSRLVRKLLGGKVPDVIKRATHVVAGNRYLADFACRFSSFVTVVPPT